MESPSGAPMPRQVRLNSSDSVRSGLNHLGNTNTRCHTDVVGTISLHRRRKWGKPSLSTVSQQTSQEEEENKVELYGHSLALEETEDPSSSLEAKGHHSHSSGSTAASNGLISPWNMYFQSKGSPSATSQITDVTGPSVTSLKIPPPKPSPRGGRAADRSGGDPQAEDGMYEVDMLEGNDEGEVRDRGLGSSSFKCQSQPIPIPEVLLSGLRWNRHQRDEEGATPEPTDFPVTQQHSSPRENTYQADSKNQKMYFKMKRKVASDSSRKSGRSRRKRVVPEGAHRSLSEGLNVDTRSLVAVPWSSNFSRNVESNDDTEVHKDMKGSGWQISFHDIATEMRNTKQASPRRAFPNTPPVESHRGPRPRGMRKTGTRSRSPEIHRTRPFTPAARSRSVFHTHDRQVEQVCNGPTSSNCARKRRRRNRGCNVSDLPLPVFSNGPDIFPASGSEALVDQKPRRTASAPSVFLMNGTAGCTISHSSSSPRSRPYSQNNWAPGPPGVPMSPTRRAGEEENERERGGEFEPTQDEYSFSQDSPRSCSHSAFIATGPYSTIPHWSTTPTPHASLSMDEGSIGDGGQERTTRGGEEGWREGKQAPTLDMIPSSDNSLDGRYEGENECPILDHREEEGENDDEDEVASVSYEETYQRDEGMTFDLEL